MSDLANKVCAPCEEGVPPLNEQEVLEFLNHLKVGWCVVNKHHLEKNFQFKDFRTALSFTNRVGDLAESQGHHPNINLSWGKVKLSIWTHKIDGLTENDFIFAAKVDNLEDS